MLYSFSVPLWDYFRTRRSPICQRQPLRGLLDLAPRKYPRMRDFEAQVVKRLVYFERAEQDEPPPLLEPAGKR
ncbi:MAG: hypothetical protein ABIJ39_08665 [Chloroflexota bacterium]